MLQRGGEVVIRMLENVKQVTIGPLIERTIAKGTLVYTDEYDIYSRLVEWGYEPRDGLSCGGRVRPGRRRGRVLRGPCQHARRILVAAAVVAPPPPRNPAGEPCRCTWDSSSSFTTSGPVARGCWGP